VRVLLQSMRKLVQQIREELSHAPAQDVGIGLRQAPITEASSSLNPKRECDQIRFGQYTADLTTHELWRNGIKVKLAGQPFIILEALLRHPGKLITREELRSRIWPGNTFVDFDHGLNAAVNKLREALGDSVSNPQYIETLPRRGYRFLAKVEALPFVHEASSLAQRSRSNPGTALLPLRTLASQEPNR
jgi:DNA-binding winged helix-turn-helix (wHTH) protein